MAAENEALLRFISANRQVPDGSSLSVEFERLRQIAEVRQGVVSALAQAYEQARIEEVRNTPVLAILDPPEATATKLGRTRDALIWVVIGFVLAVSFAVGREALVHERARDPEGWRQMQSRLQRGVRSLVPGRRASGT